MTAYEVERPAWQQRDLFDQLGNIGAEVGRAIGASRQGLTERFDGALDRALDLFSATAEVLVAEQSPRLKEVLRARELFLGLFFDDKLDQDSAAIEEYFMQYATAARLRATDQLIL
jgi:hypothetical protein